MDQPIDGEVLYEVEVPEDEITWRRSVSPKWRIVRHAGSICDIDIERFQVGIERHGVQEPDEWISYGLPNWLVLHLLTQLRDLEPLRAAAVECHKAMKIFAESPAEQWEENYDAASRARARLYDHCRDLAEKGETE